MILYLAFNEERYLDIIRDLVASLWGLSNFAKNVIQALLNKKLLR